GKTALVAELVRRNPGGRVLAYHFCTSAAFMVDPASFVRSVAGMLATSIRSYAEQLSSGKLASWLTAADPATMLSQGVLAPLRDVAMDGAYCVVIDALDEALAAGGPLPALLANALPEFPPWLRLLVTSRPHQRIQRMFRQADGCLLDDRSGEHLADLQAFITGRLADPAVSAIVAPGELEQATAQISSIAAGNFQYAVTLLDAVAEGEITAATLNHLPPKLEDLYYHRARQRFPNPPDYRLARQVLTLLLAAHEPLTLATLIALSGLDPDTELQPTLDAISCFASSTATGWHIAHKSIADWLVSPDAGQFTVDLAPAQQRLLTYCRSWATSNDSYALRHVIGHLLDAGQTDEALHAVQQGLFSHRRSRLEEPRLDTEDSRSLTDELVSQGDQADIVALATTSNVWQRDGVASALQSAPPDKLPFIDAVVGALLAVPA
ncbi:MAG: hypothetical protein ACRDTN_12030, partial [Mycobacterium sp.]